MIEILQVADTLARDKGIDREQVINAIEKSIQKLVHKRPLTSND